MKKPDYQQHFPNFQPSFAHFRDKCVCCEQSGKTMNKEHIFPKWLLKRTNCVYDLINSPYGPIAGNNFVVPLCEECNSQLGKELEDPVSIVFSNIEEGLGFNDHEAELIIRWIWKINGIFYWSICNKNWKYALCTLKQKVLSRIEQPRSRISIGVALINDTYEDNKSAPVGIDAFSLWSNVYAAGVFSRLSIVVFYTNLRKCIDERFWTVYTLSEYPVLVNPKKKTFPRVTFTTGSQAISITKGLLGNNSRAYFEHEHHALMLRQIMIQKCL